jgi:hypothetical protein
MNLSLWKLLIKTKYPKNSNMQHQNEYFIRTKGKAEFKTYHLIRKDTFDMLDVFFNSELEAQQYAHKNLLILVAYKETFEKQENGE